MASSSLPASSTSSSGWPPVRPVPWRVPRWSYAGDWAPPRQYPPGYLVGIFVAGVIAGRLWTHLECAWWGIPTTTTTTTTAWSAAGVAASPPAVPSASTWVHAYTLVVLVYLTWTWICWNGLTASSPQRLLLEQASSWSWEQLLAWFRERRSTTPLSEKTAELADKAVAEIEREAAPASSSSSLAPTLVVTTTTTPPPPPPQQQEPEIISSEEEVASARGKEARPPPPHLTSDHPPSSVSSENHHLHASPPPVDMSGAYKLVSNDGFEAFLEVQGVPWALRRAANAARPTHRITHRGRQLTIRIEGLIESETTYQIYGPPVETNVRGRIFEDTVSYLEGEGGRRGIQVRKRAVTEDYDVTVVRELSPDRQTIVMTSTAQFRDGRTPVVSRQVFRRCE